MPESCVLPPRVLIIDDNQDAADSMARLLGLTGYDVQVAYDGFVGLALADTLQPTAVLLDLGIPHMDGFEIAHAIRQREWGRQALLIAVTGWSRQQDEAAAQQAGFDCYLVKPVPTTTLLTVLPQLTVAQPTS